MAKLKNKNYLEFIRGGFIKFVNEDHIIEVINNITTKNCKYPDEAKALIIAMYYTGARPCEILDIKGCDIYRVQRYVYFKIPGKKRGFGRVIMTRNTELTKIMLKHINKVFPSLYCFQNFRGNNIQKYKTKKGEIKKYVITTYKLRYWFNLWFKNVIDVNPYYLRHNRISKLASEGISLTDLQQFKGSKTIASIQPYIHLSTHTAKRIASKNK